MQENTPREEHDSLPLFDEKSAPAAPSGPAYPFPALSGFMPSRPAAEQSPEEELDAAVDADELDMIQAENDPDVSFEEPSPEIDPLPLDESLPPVAAAEPPPAKPEPAATSRPNPRLVREVQLQSFGAYLRDLRNRNRLSIAEVAEDTKIRSTYLESIEEEDYSSLPPAVYVTAYVKTVCEYYGVPAETVEQLTSDIRARQSLETPGAVDFTKSVIDIETSQENPILLKRILLIAAGGIFLIALLVAIIIFAFVSDKDAPAATTQKDKLPPQVLEQRLLDLQDQPKLDVTELPRSL